MFAHIFDNAINQRGSRENALELSTDNLVLVCGLGLGLCSSAHFCTEGRLGLVDASHLVSSSEKL